MIEKLRQLQPEVIMQYLQTKDAESLGIPEVLANYILQVTDASKLIRSYKSISECAKRLQLLYPKLSISTCRNRVYDAITYYNSDCTVTPDAWNNYFADEMMKLFRINIAAHDFKEARVCFERAREYRLEASKAAIAPDRIKFKQQLISPDTTLARMGVDAQGLLEAHKKAYSIIRSQDMPSDDRQRLFREVDRELNITEADYEEISDQ